MIYMVETIPENDGSDKYFKIGYTGGDVKSRIAQWKTGCPFDVWLTVCSDGNSNDESELHELLSEWRVSGEWFRYTQESAEVAIRYILAADGSKEYIVRDAYTAEDILGYADENDMPVTNIGAICTMLHAESAPHVWGVIEGWGSPE